MPFVQEPLVHHDALKPSVHEQVNRLSLNENLNCDGAMHQRLEPLGRAVLNKPYNLGYRRAGQVLYGSDWLYSLEAGHLIGKILLHVR